MSPRPVVLGIDIGGTNTVLGLVDENGKCYYKSQIPTEANLPADVFFSNIFKNINTEFEKNKNNYELVGIGIGAPCANINKGTIENPSNFSWGYVEVAKLTEKYYKVPVLVTNDANVAAVGEMMYGAARNINDFIMITLGTGLGSGIVVNGNLVYGADGFAGELGHTIIDERGRKCNCGRSGCLETYVSASGIRRTVFELLSYYTDDSSLREYAWNDLTAKDIYDAAMAGDKIANLAFEKTGEKLGMALANSVAHLSPEAIVLYGGLAYSGDLIINPTIKYMEKNMLSLYKGKVKIIASGLMGSEDAAVLGAAALIWKEMEKNGKVSHVDGKNKTQNQKVA